MAKKKVKKKFAYKHKVNGKFLKMCYIGDGEVYLNFVNKITRDCVLDSSSGWTFKEILETSDMGAELNSEWVDFTPEDFDEVEIEESFKIR